MQVRIYHDKTWTQFHPIKGATKAGKRELVCTIEQKKASGRCPACGAEGVPILETECCLDCQEEGLRLWNEEHGDTMRSEVNGG